MIQWLHIDHVLRHFSFIGGEYFRQLDIEDRVACVEILRAFYDICFELQFSMSVRQFQHLGLEEGRVVIQDVVLLVLLIPEPYH